MIFAPGTTVYGSFGITSGDTAANADSAPTLVVRVNGTIGAISVSQTNPTTGEYTFSFAVPGGASIGDWYEVLVTATVGGKVQPRQCVMEGRVDNTIASRSTYAGGNVTVGAYAAGQSPADLVLSTPANKLVTDASGRVTVGTIIASALTAIRGELESAGNILDTLKTRTTGLTATLIGYLANLNIGGNVASSASVQNITQGTFLSFDIPNVLERPDAGTEALVLSLAIADETGQAADFDAGADPTIALLDASGASLAARLGAWSHPGTGLYRVTYTSSAAHTLERIRWEVSGTINGKLRRFVASTQIVDTTKADFSMSDRTDLQNALATIQALANKFTGATSIPNWLRLLGRKSAGDATALSEFNNGGGTFDPTTDSGEAVRDVVGTPAAGTVASTLDATKTVADASKTAAENTDGKLSTGRLTLLDRLIGMIEAIPGGGGAYRWLAAALTQAPVTAAAPTTTQNAQAVTDRLVTLGVLEDSDGAGAGTAHRLTGQALTQAPVTDANTVAAAVVAQALIKNMAGLTGANQACRDFTYDGSGNLTSFRIRLYDSAENAQADNGATGLVASYLVTNTLNGSGQITKTTTKLE